MDSAVLVDHKMKMKRCENIDKYLEFTRDLKRVWKMKVMSVLILVDVFGNFL